MKNNRKTLGRMAILLALALSAALMISAGAASLPAAEIDEIFSVETDKSQVESPITRAVDMVRDSMVGVNNYRTIASTNRDFGFGFGGMPRARQQVFMGSGVVISRYGHILTNYHVIEGADRVTVTYGTKEAEATVVVSDENLDAAVLLVPGIDLEPVQLGDSDQLQVGEWAIVVGNPLGQEFERTVSLGVVSAFDREVESDLTDRYGRRDTVTRVMIQVDAAINSGNSGGGLFNVLGQLQGIPTMKYVRQGGSPFGFGFGLTAPSVDNIGMCIPINSAKPLIRQALEKYDGESVSPAEIIDHSEEAAAAADASKPRIGVQVDTLNPNSSLMRSGQLPRGAVVMRVETGSPADQAGLQPGDILVEANGVLVDSAQALVGELAGKQVGDRIEVKYFRAEGLMDIIQGNKEPSELGKGEYATVTMELKVLDQNL